MLALWTIRASTQGMPGMVKATMEVGQIGSSKGNELERRQGKRKKGQGQERWKRKGLEWKRQFSMQVSWQESELLGATRDNRRMGMGRLPGSELLQLWRSQPSYGFMGNVTMMLERGMEEVQRINETIETIEMIAATKIDSNQDAVVSKIFGERDPLRNAWRPLPVTVHNCFNALHDNGTNDNANDSDSNVNEIDATDEDCDASSDEDAIRDRKTRRHRPNQRQRRRRRTQLQTHDQRLHTTTTITDARPAQTMGGPMSGDASGQWNQANGSTSSLQSGGSGNAIAVLRVAPRFGWRPAISRCFVPSVAAESWIQWGNPFGHALAEAVGDAVAQDGVADADWIGLERCFEMCGWHFAPEHCGDLKGDNPRRHARQFNATYNNAIHNVMCNCNDTCMFDECMSDVNVGAMLCSHQTPCPKPGEAHHPIALRSQFLAQNLSTPRWSDTEPLGQLRVPRHNGTCRR